MSSVSVPDGSSWTARIHLSDYLRVVYRRRWLAVVVFLAVVLGAAVYTYTAEPLYQAQASVLIELERPNVIDIEEVLNEAPDYQTQYELLQSRALVQRTVAALQLWTRPGFPATTEIGAVDAVGGALQIAPVRGTRLVHIRVRWPDPDVAAEIANEHARQYVEQNLDVRFQASKQASDWLEEQLAEERKRVEAGESALQAYREKYDAISLTEGQNIVVQKLSDLNAAVTRAKTQRIEAEAQYRELVAIEHNRDALDAFPAILSNGFIQQLKGTLVAQQREYAQMSQTLGERHPQLVELRTALETTERRLDAEVARVVDSLRQTYRSAVAEETSLTRALDEAKREALALNRRGIEYAALEREAESMRLVYQTLLQRAKETSVSRELRSTNIRVIDPARRPGRPVHPRTTLNLLMAVAAGLFLGVGAAFVVETVDDRIKTPDDVRTQLGLPFFGLVPEIRMGEKTPSLLEDPPPSFVEAFRTLRTSVVSSPDAKGPVSIVVASASPGEGKTTVAANLAMTLAQAHQRVLLVDGDMRRPRMHELFDQQLEPGLSNVLAGTASLADVLRPTSLAGLTVLSAGTPSPDAPELLGSAAFNHLFGILKEHYPWVIVDCPPALSVTDASLVASQATGIVFVVGSGMTGARTARLAIEELQRTGARVLGSVLNRADLQHHPYYFGPYVRGEYLKSLKVTAERPAAATSSAMSQGA
jgi:polysaccharide biosynthesis transport protein